MKWAFVALLVNIVISNGLWAQDQVTLKSLDLKTFKIVKKTLWHKGMKGRVNVFGLPEQDSLSINEVLGDIKVDPHIDSHSETLKNIN